MCVKNVSSLWLAEADLLGGGGGFQYVKIKRGPRKAQKKIKVLGPPPPLEKKF